MVDLDRVIEAMANYARLGLVAEGDALFQEIVARMQLAADDEAEVVVG